jgi:hypothetical protein
VVISAAQSVDVEPPLEPLARYAPVALTIRYSGNAETLLADGDKFIVTPPAAV